MTCGVKLYYSLLRFNAQQLSISISFHDSWASGLLL